MDQLNVYSDVLIVSAYLETNHVHVQERSIGIFKFTNEKVLSIDVS